MLTDLNAQPDTSKAEELTNELHHATNAESQMLDKEILFKEFDNYRYEQIYKQLPDHCIQLCFLS